MHDVTQHLTGSRYALADDEEARWWLTVYHRDGARTVALDGPVVVGREAPADIVVDDVSLSRQHARLALEGGAVVVEDLGSTNGTWLRGDRVERAALGAEREVVLGDVVCAVHLASAPARGGLWSHDRIVDRLEQELVRAEHFGREVVLLLVRGTGEERHARHWWREVASRVRAVDAVGLFSEDTLEVVAPELPADDVEAWAKGIVAAFPDLRVAAARYPNAASSAASLLAAARRRFEGTSARRPLVLADEEVARPVPNEDDAPVAVSATMREALETAKLLARGVIPVLLEGETGSGKEVVARFVHGAGPRADRPLVAVNCGGLSPQLVESTLFGHEKGAFTGAHASNKGVFEAADGGTLFLDEIGELPPAAQASLLRVLEDRTVTRVGSTKPIPVDVRIVAATHRNLEAMADDGRFRRDLLYRLNAMTLRVPPLRQRPEDVAPLAARFLARANRESGTEVTLARETLRLLQDYPWPGNARELRNAIDRGVAIARHGVITPRELPERLRAARLAEAPPEEPARMVPRPAAALRAPEEDFRSCMERLESTVIIAVLDGVGWNKAEAARRLQMPRRTLVHRIKALGLERPVEP